MMAQTQRVEPTALTQQELDIEVFSIAIDRLLVMRNGLAEFNKIEEPILFAGLQALVLCTSITLGKLVEVKQ
jgi:hypothetical protein